jgi:hypothetical protein
MRIAQVAAAPSPYLSRGAYALVQEELDFALEIFKVAYTKRQFDGPYVFTFFARLHRRNCVLISPAGTHWLFALSTTSSSRLA